MTDNINEFIDRYLVTTALDIEWQTRAESPACQRYIFGGTFQLFEWQVLPENVIFKGDWQPKTWYEERCTCGDCYIEAHRTIHSSRRAPIERDNLGNIFAVEINRQLMEPHLNVWNRGLRNEVGELFTWISPMTKVTVKMMPPWAVSW